LQLAVPEEWESVQTLADLQNYARSLGRPLRIVTKFERLTTRFLNQHAIQAELVTTEGTLETAPAIGYADMISDLVSSGQTLKDNRLRALPDGIILRSQSSLIANFQTLKTNPQAQSVARFLLEFIEAYLRAQGNVSIFVNMRGDNAQRIARRLFENEVINGLQGPTISPVFVKDAENTGWYAVNVVVKREELFEAITALRAVGGSGVVVLPVTYIFEEEPPRYTAMLKAIQTGG